VNPSKADGPEDVRMNQDHDQRERQKQPIRTFRDLLVWQKAIQVARSGYQITRHFPRDERCGLTLQVPRAAGSVSSNITEGHARQGREFAHFLSVSRGSLAEVESQILLRVELGFVSTAVIEPVLATAGVFHRKLASLASKLSR
jgi:four helix bundle protein